MKKFVIVTDSCADLNGELRKKYDIEYLCMRVIEGNIDRPADLDWQFMPAKTFYDKMREGIRFTTSQITASDYEDAFEKYISEGCDVLSFRARRRFQARLRRALSPATAYLKIIQRARFSV